MVRDIDLEMLENKLHQTHISRHFIYASMVSFSHKPQILLSFISAAQYLVGASRASDYTGTVTISAANENPQREGPKHVIVVKIKTKFRFQI